MTTTVQPQTRYRLLKTDIAAKLGLRAQGGITYQLLVDPEGHELYLTVVANDGGGYWSREVISFSKVEDCLSTHADSGLPFPSLLLRHAFVGRSSNNAPFLVAVLRDLGLLQAAPGKPFQHLVTGDWSEWKAHWLNQPGENILLPALVPGAVQAGECATAEARPADDAVDLPEAVDDSDDESTILSLLVEDAETHTPTSSKSQRRRKGQAAVTESEDDSAA